MKAPTKATRKQPRLILVGISLAVSATWTPVHAQAVQATVQVIDEAAAAKPVFEVNEFRVLGNSALPAEVIETTLEPFLSEKRTIDDVELARKALESAYHGAGWGTVFVDIPEQSTVDGVIRLNVTEGRLDRVRITGARYFANGRIRSQLAEIASGKVPNLPLVQAELTAINRQSSDRSVIPLLKAGRIPGSVDLDLKVNDQLPLHGSLEVNDRYTADTSRWRVNASLSYNNLFQRQHSFTLQYQTAPQEFDEVQAIVGSYVFRIPALANTTFAVYAVDSKTDVSALGTLSVIGNGNIFGVRAIQQFQESSNYFHNATFGVDYKDFLEKIQLAADQELNTPIRYVNWSMAYSGTLRGESFTTISDIAANIGVRSIGNDPSDFAEKRFRGSANYSYLRGGLQHLRKLPWNFQAYGRASGQITTNALVSNEQFAIGGVDTVRGYLESSQLGDYGMGGTFELRNGWLAQPLKLAADTTYVFAFYDIATAAIVDPLPAQSARFNLSSWGIGLRIARWHGFDLAIDWAKVLEDAGEIQRGDDRAHFSAKYAF